MVSQIMHYVFVYYDIPKMLGKVLMFLCRAFYLSNSILLIQLYYSSLFDYVIYVF